MWWSWQRKEDIQEKVICPECGGTRLRKEAGYVKVGDATITQLVSMPVDRLSAWFDNLKLDDTDARIAERLLVEIRSRLTFLCEVGLGYLTLDRPVTTLSGGESQRVKLATYLAKAAPKRRRAAEGEKLLFVLDEPSTGLHFAELDLLLRALYRLRAQGHTLLCIEHNSAFQERADYVVELGPGSGSEGGRIVYAGPPAGRSARGFARA